MNGAGTLVHQLEECIRKSADLFNPELIKLRSKLKDYCERVMFNDPLEYGLRAEELMWRKVFYEYIQFVKSKHKLNASSSYTGANHAISLSLEQQILAGIGYYTHLLHRLQTEYQYPLSSNFIRKDRGLKKNTFKKFQKHHESDAKVYPYIHQACHRCFVFLGDLSRYQGDLGHTNTRHISQMYYRQAIRLEPSFGMPYNQLGTLLNTTNHGCSAIYNYLRCLLCFHSFEGAENNLQRFLEANVVGDVPPLKDNDDNAAKIKHFLSLFLKLCYNLFKGKAEDAQVSCFQFIQSFDSCLLLSEDANNNQESPTTLGEEIIFQVCSISMMFISRLSEKNASLVTLATGLTLSLLSHLIYQCSQALQSALNQFNESPKNTKSELSKKPHKNAISHLRQLRRRRKAMILSQDDSELSENEDGTESENDDKADLLSNINSDSDIESESSESNGEEETTTTTTTKDGDEDSSRIKSNGESSLDSHESPAKPEHPSSPEISNPTISYEEFIDIIINNRYLPSLKILCDWMRLSTNVYCDSPDMNLLWAYYVNFFNILLKIESIILKEEGTLSVDIKKLVEKANNNICNQEKPLPEDFELRSLTTFLKIHSNIDFEKSLEMQPYERSLYRIHCILNFGRFLMHSNKTPVKYDSQKAVFYLSEENSAPSNEKDSNGSGNTNTCGSQKTVMRNMAHLWLKSEVSDLEMQVKFNNRQHTFSPYLVPDTSALCCCLPSLKSLLALRKFIFVIPSVVITSLDLLKRSSLESREAIRWLESELKRGNRFIRAQRAPEKLSLAPVKYPRKKEKEIWEYFKVLECCHYLSQQGHDLVSLVTADVKSIAPPVPTLASSIGITIKNADSLLATFSHHQKAVLHEAQRVKAQENIGGGGGGGKGHPHLGFPGNRRAYFPASFGRSPKRNYINDPRYYFYHQKWSRNRGRFKR